MAEEESKKVETESPSDPPPAPAPEPVVGGVVITRVLGFSSDRKLERIEREKTSSEIKAWEESEKSKAENKANKELSSIAAWENRKKAAVEGELKKIEEQPKNKAEYVEKMNNKIALIHKKTEEKRAMIEAKQWKGFLKVEEKAAEYRATRTAPKKHSRCFGIALAFKFGFHCFKNQN